ncbi:transposase [Xanthobacter dioxanivorans]|uniref:Transposase n=1 Tax=Xanthobacter dioxanivorans TaxID=2528964 RepID=A0A974SKX9_9HYPH|nr:transposase [Xanthobacter dioxanivorans]
MGRSQGGLTTKIHALGDAEGRPIHLALTAGQAGDAPAGRELLARFPPGGILLADKAYDTDAIRAEMAERSTFAKVPPRVIRKRTFAFSPWLYRQRTTSNVSSTTSIRCVALPRAKGGRGPTSCPCLEADASTVANEPVSLCRAAHTS